MLHDEAQSAKQCEPGDDETHLVVLEASEEMLHLLDKRIGRQDIDDPLRAIISFVPRHLRPNSRGSR